MASFPRRDGCLEGWRFGRGRRSSDAVVSESVRGHGIGIIKITPIDHDGILQLLMQAIQIQAGEFVPFRENQESVSVPGGSIGISRVLNTRIENLSRPLVRCGTVSRNLAALSQQR